MERNQRGSNRVKNVAKKRLVSCQQKRIQGVETHKQQTTQQQTHNDQKRVVDRARSLRRSRYRGWLSEVHSVVVDVTVSPTDVPVLTLTEATGKLVEVQVTAKKPFVGQQSDCMVINVAQSIVGSSSTALEKSPGVTVDYQNERIQLRGKNGGIVQIDGKQTWLSAQDVVALLRPMSSNNIVLPRLNPLPTPVPVMTEKHRFERYSYTFSEVKRLLTTYGLRIVAAYNSTERGMYQLGDQQVYLVAEKQ